MPVFHVVSLPLRSGVPFSVTVESAPCDPATVTFFANGVLIATKSCAVGSAVQFTCPGNHAGRSWKVVVACPSGVSSEQTGTIA